MAQDKAILVVSFGTSYKETREKTIGAIEHAIGAAYPDWEVRRAFTSGFIMKKILREEGLKISNVEESLRQMAEDGIKDVIIQPTHMMNGGEYDKLMEQCRTVWDQFEGCRVGAPLLTDAGDFEQLAEAITKATEAYDDGQTAICFMGHGTNADSNTVYTDLQNTLQRAGHDHHYIGTVEAAPSLEDLLAAVKAESIYKRVVLQPLMVVAGDHAINDMACDEEDSWKSTFAAAGYDVHCILEGLGENPDIQQMYVRHVADAMRQLEEEQK